MFRHRYVELGKAVAIIDALGLDVLCFFARMLAPAYDAVAVFIRENAPKGGAVPVIEQAADRFHGRTPSPRDVSMRRAAPHAYRLQRIAVLIDQDPEEAAKQAETQIAASLQIGADVDAAEPVARGLGYYATACCRTGRPRTAQQALSLGLEIALTHDLRPVIADLTRQGVEVLRYRHAHATAQRFASSALQRYEEMGDTAGRALALIEKGLLLERVGRQHASLKALTEALPLLPDNDGKSSVTASWTLARIALHEGALEDAEHHAMAAVDLASGVGGEAIGWLYRLQAAIAERRGASDEAALHLEKARQVFAATAQPHGLALVVAELIRLQRQRRTEVEACETAKRLLPSLLTSFERNRSATRALGELLTAAKADRLTTEVIDQVVQAIEQADPEVRWR